MLGHACKHRADEQLGVGMLRIVQHLVGQPGLHHHAALHHHDAVRQQAGHGEVVGDQHHGDVQPRDQRADQVEQARLHRDVEPAGRLVHEHQARMGHQGAGDLQALQHAARESARHVVDAGGIDLHLGQPVDRLGADVAVVTAPAAISRSPTLPPAQTPMRRLSRGFWCTKPQSVRVSSAARPAGSARHGAGGPRVPDRPPSGRIRPDRHFSSVVLPEPDSPTTASTSPGQRSSSRAAGDAAPPKCLVMPRPEGPARAATSPALAMVGVRADEHAPAGVVATTSSRNFPPRTARSTAAPG